jgi:hypothetical protein
MGIRIIKTNGICAYCKVEIAPNPRSILSHLSECKGKTITESGNRAKCVILLIEGKYNPEYWIVVKAKPGDTLKKLDKFIRDIWVECCGHLSEFHEGRSTIGMTHKIGDVFEKGSKIDYIYDFGSSTELTLSFLDESEEADDKKIQIMMRNKEIYFKCSHCEKQAVAVCPYCIHEDGGLLCESCIKKHKCVKEEGEEILGNLVNSPRMGECGYEGYLPGDVKKYFPNGII